MEKILIVDDDEGLVHFLCRYFVKQGYDVRSCGNGEAALGLVGREIFDLILLDYKMTGMNGLDTLREIRRSQVKTPVIVMTAYGTTDTAIEAMKIGAYDYLRKPFEREELHRLVTDALAVNHMMKEVVSFPGPGRSIPRESKGVAKIIGNHRRMQEVYKLIGQVADKNVTILITGESGTGKELVARAIYHHSHRKKNPFLAINCAAIPDTLFESELFGHERGAFTGAERIHIGKFERCDGGTVFLDEIGEMPLSSQAKVLRILQSGEFERLGGNQTIKTDVRILAATNKNLQQEVEAGKFREDLYWRLKIISIQLPSLRERVEDIPDLVTHFVNRFSEEYHTPIRYVDDNAIERLKTCSWAGNVRELENCVRRAVVLSMGDVILQEHFQFEADPPSAASPETPDQLRDRINKTLDALFMDLLRLSDNNVHANMIEMVEQGIVLKSLKQCRYNQVKAAKILGISRNTLRHRIKKFNITQPPK